jgi:hypothetical protein
MKRLILCTMLGWHDEHLMDWLDNSRSEVRCCLRCRQLFTSSWVTDRIAREGN